MKRATAIRHLVEMAEEATGRLPLRSSEFGWPLTELELVEVQSSRRRRQNRSLTVTER